MEQLFLPDEQSLIELFPMVPDEILAERESNADVKILGIGERGEPAGVIVTENEGADTRLRFIFLEEEARGEGVARRALISLMYECYMDGAGRLLASYVPKEYPRVKRLLSGFDGSIREEESGSFYVTLEELSGIKLFQRPAGRSVSIADAGQIELNAFCQLLKERRLGMGLNSIPKEDYLPSSPVYREGGRVEAVMLVKENEDGSIYVPLLVSLSDNPLAIPDMISFAVADGLKRYPKGTEIEFHIINPSLLLFMEKVLGRKAQRRVEQSIDLGVYAGIVREIEDRLQDPMLPGTNK